MVRAGSIRWLKKPLTMSVNTTPAVTSTGASSIAAAHRLGAGGARRRYPGSSGALSSTRLLPHISVACGTTSAASSASSSSTAFNRCTSKSASTVSWWSAMSLAAASVNSASARGLVPPV